MRAPHLLLLDGSQEEAPLAVGERRRLHGHAVRVTGLGGKEGGRARHRRAPRVPNAHAPRSLPRARPLREGTAVENPLRGAAWKNFPCSPS